MTANLRERHFRGFAVNSGTGSQIPIIQFVKTHLLVAHMILFSLNDQLKVLDIMKCNKFVIAIASVIGLVVSQAPLASAQPMDEKSKQLCAAIGLIYHLQAKGYDDKIKQGKELVKKSNDPKMNKLMEATFRDMAAVRDNTNKLGDFMERQFGKAESTEQINFAQQSIGTPLTKLKEYSDNCLQMKAFG
jgi:hypothetical protein